MKDVFLKKWEYAGDRVRLVYRDGTVAFVSKTDFDRAFGCIVSAPKADVVRDFVIGTDDDVFLECMGANKADQLPAKPKLVKPKRYPQIAKRLKRHLTVRNEKDVVSLGFTKTASKKKNGRYRKTFCYDASRDVGYPCSINVATDNGKVAVMEYELPLFFHQDSMDVPDSKVMEHLDFFFTACFRKLGLEYVVGPILDSEENPIEWSTAIDLDEIAVSHALKYEDIYMARCGFGGIIYPCRDAKGNLWLIEVFCDKLSEKMQEELGLRGVYIKLYLTKLARRKGEPFKVVIHHR